MTRALGAFARWSGMVGPMEERVSESEKWDKETELSDIEWAGRRLKRVYRERKIDLGNGIRTEMSNETWTEPK